METILIALMAAVFYLFLKQLMPVVGVRQKTPDELKRRMRDKEIQFIDVRTLDGSVIDTIRGFENIPLKELSGSIQKLERSNEIVLISDNAREMKKASAKLKRRGFRYVTTVRGGIQAWRNA